MNMARKSSLKILNSKKTIKIIKSFYDDFGKVIKQNVELITK